MKKYTDDNRNFFDRYGKDLQALYGNIKNMNIENSYNELNEKYKQAKLLTESQNKFLKMNSDIAKFRKEHGDNGNEDLMYKVLNYNDKDKEFYNEFKKKNILPMDLNSFGGLFNDYLNYFQNQGKTGIPYYKSTMNLSKDLYLSDIENKILQAKQLQTDAFKTDDVQFLDKSILENNLYKEWLNNKDHSTYRNFYDFLEGSGKKDEFYSGLNAESLKEANEKMTMFKKARDEKYNKYNQSIDEVFNSFIQQHSNTPFDRLTYDRIKKEIEGLRIKNKSQQPKFVAADQQDNVVIYRNADGSLYAKPYQTPGQERYPDYKNLLIKKDDNGKYFRHEVVKKPDNTWELRNTGIEATEEEYNKQAGIYPQRNNIGFRYSGKGNYTFNKLGYIPGDIMKDYFNLLEDNYGTGGLSYEQAKRLTEIENIMKIYNLDIEQIKGEYRKFYDTQSKDNKQPYDKYNEYDNNKF